MLTLKACSCGWTPAGDAYNGLAMFPVSQPGVRNQNDRASCGFAILRRAPRKWPDRSLRAHFSLLIVVFRQPLIFRASINAASCLLLYPRSLCTCTRVLNKSLATQSRAQVHRECTKNWLRLARVGCGV